MMPSRYAAPLGPGGPPGGYVHAALCAGEPSMIRRLVDLLRADRRTQSRAVTMFGRLFTIARMCDAHPASPLRAWARRAAEGGEDPEIAELAWYLLHDVDDPALVERFERADVPAEAVIARAWRQHAAVALTPGLSRALRDVTWSEVSGVLETLVREVIVALGQAAAPGFAALAGELRGPAGPAHAAVFDLALRGRDDRYLRVDRIASVLAPFRLPVEGGLADFDPRAFLASCPARRAELLDAYEEFLDAAAAGAHGFEARYRELWELDHGRAVALGRRLGDRVPAAIARALRSGETPAEALRRIGLVRATDNRTREVSFEPLRILEMAKRAQAIDDDGGPPHHTGLAYDLAFVARGTIGLWAFEEAAGTLVAYSETAREDVELRDVDGGYDLARVIELLERTAPGLRWAAVAGEPDAEATHVVAAPPEVLRAAFAEQLLCPAEIPALR